MIPWGDDTPLERQPVVTYALAATSILLVPILGVRSGFGQVMETYGFAPGALEPLRAVSALFLSGSFLHALFGLVFLLGVGRVVEDTVGRVAFLLYYVMGGVFTFGMYYALHPNSPEPIPGAVGAIGAILAGYLVLFPRGTIRVAYWGWFWRGSIFLPAWGCIALWFAVEFLVGYRGQSGIERFPFAQWAHVGGFAAGALIALPLRVIAARLAPAFDRDLSTGVHVPAIVQQQQHVRWRAESSTSGELLDDRRSAWAEKIDRELQGGTPTRALRLFERHTDAHSTGALEPGTRYKLAEACLGRGRYWRAVTLLESLLSGGACPSALVNRVHALLAALHGEHPYFHETAIPHLDVALAALPTGSTAHDLLRQVQKRVEAARHRNFTAGEHDRFCLLRESHDSYRIVEAAPLIAKATGRDTREIMRDLRNNPGILAWKQPRQPALDLAATLGHAGIRVAVVPLPALRGYGKTEPVEYVAVKSVGIEIHHAGGTTVAAWDNLALVTGGFLMLTNRQQQRVYEETRDAALQGGDAFQSFDSMVRELRHLTLMDFWLKEPLRHLRVREHPLRMPEAQLQSVASAILRAAPNVPRNAGLDAIATGVVPADCIFDSRDYFTYYGTWQLYLRQWDDLPAVSDSLIQNLVTELRA